MKTLILGGGCFWCMEAVFQRVKGVESVLSGYAGGDVMNPTYEMVGTGATDHAEVVKLTYDPATVKLDDLLDIFWTVHDPTTPDRQGDDIGTQYRSIIFFNDETEWNTIMSSIEKARETWGAPIVTEVEPVGHFYPAEDEHQKYFAHHPDAVYCKVVIHPKLETLRRHFQQILKK